MIVLFVWMRLSVEPNKLVSLSAIVCPLHAHSIQHTHNTHTRTHTTHTHTYTHPAEEDEHEGKRACEALWPIFRIHHQRSRYIYEMYYKHKKISREVYNYCLREKHADQNLIAKWKKVHECFVMLSCFVFWVASVCVCVGKYVSGVRTSMCVWLHVFAMCIAVHRVCIPCALVFVLSGAPTYCLSLSTYLQSLYLPIALYPPLSPSVIRAARLRELVLSQVYAKARHQLRYHMHLSCAFQ